MILSTFGDSINAFLKNNALFIALAVVGVILITLIVLLIRGRKSK